jgi:hypothetical protein
VYGDFDSLINGPCLLGASCGDSLLNVVMSPGGHEEQQGDNGSDGENQRDQGCYVFLTYDCAHNGLSLGPSSLLRHTLPSRTDYDSYTSF